MGHLARNITLALHGRWCGSYGIALCPAHDNRRTPALSLANGHDGKLLAKCFAGCSFIDIIEALRGLGILEQNGQTYAPDPAELVRHHEADKAERHRRIAQAKRIWDESLPVAGSLAETYLRGRAISIAVPDTLRFHPNCWHSPSARRHPALVGKVERHGRPVGVMRTYLGPNGGKAQVENPKMALGVCAGGAVRLSGGLGPLVVAEGIETALSLLSGLPDACPRVWAALSTSGMAGLVLPRGPGELVLAPDGDAPGRGAANKLADRATTTGWHVRIMRCPDGSDWNDVSSEVAA